jgi:hypothetical protein
MRSDTEFAADARTGETALVRGRPHKLVLIEPKPPGYHIFSKSKLPRLGTVLLGAIARDLGWEVHVGNGRQWNAEFPFGRPERVEPGLLNLGAAVREVETRGIHAGAQAAMNSP